MSGAGNLPKYNINRISKDRINIRILNLTSRNTSMYIIWLFFTSRSHNTELLQQHCALNQMLECKVSTVKTQVTKQLDCCPGWYQVSAWTDPTERVLGFSAKGQCIAATGKPRGLSRNDLKSLPKSSGDLTEHAYEIWISFSEKVKMICSVHSF